MINSDLILKKKKEIGFNTQELHFQTELFSLIHTYKKISNMKYIYRKTKAR